MRRKNRGRNSRDGKRKRTAPHIEHSGKIKVGNIEIGGQNKVIIQSMTTTKTSNINETITISNTIHLKLFNVLKNFIASYLFITFLPVIFGAEIVMFSFAIYQAVMVIVGVVICSKNYC